MDELGPAEATAEAGLNSEGTDATTGLLAFDKGIASLDIPGANGGPNNSEPAASIGAGEGAANAAAVAVMASPMSGTVEFNVHRSRHCRLGHRCCAF